MNCIFENEIFHKLDLLNYFPRTVLYTQIGGTTEYVRHSIYTRLEEPFENRSNAAKIF